MEIDPRLLYRFRFQSPGMSDNLFHFVLTDDIEKMKMFLTQHNFQDTNPVVDYVKKDEHDDETEFMLRPFMLKSNSSDKIFHIMSTEHMMHECGNEIASRMSSALVFGPTIIREDVPIMKVISELINALDQTYVLDYTLCDPATGKPFSSAYEQYVKTGYRTTPYDYLTLTEASYDDSALYETLTRISYDNPQPFTLEMYISYFAGLLTDSYF